MLAVSPLINFPQESNKVSSILKIKNLGSSSPLKQKKRSIVNFPTADNQDQNRLEKNVIVEETTKKTTKIPKVAEAMYKIVVLIRIKNLILSRSGLSKPILTKDDRLVYANDLAYNSEKQEKDIFLKKYFEKNVPLIFFIEKKSFSPDFQETLLQSDVLLQI